MAWFSIEKLDAYVYLMVSVTLLPQEVYPQGYHLSWLDSF